MIIKTFDRSDSYYTTSFLKWKLHRVRCYYKFVNMQVYVINIIKITFIKGEKKSIKLLRSETIQIN